MIVSKGNNTLEAGQDLAVDTDRHWLCGADSGSSRADGIASAAQVSGWVGGISPVADCATGGGFGGAGGSTGVGI